MIRDTERLQSQSFDVIVVGMGVHGATAAMEASQRGLSVAVIDKGDIGSATSHNSLKIIHGGIRYLQHLDIGRVRQSIQERSFWLRCAPHMTAPLDFWIPLRGMLSTRGPAALWAAIQAHSLVGLRRNRGIADSRRIPTGGLQRGADVEKQLGSLWGESPPAAAVWWDGQMLDSDRLILECVMSASDNGAVVANYVAAKGLQTSSRGQVAELQVHDLLDDKEYSVKASNVVLAAGPWSEQMAGDFGSAASASDGAGLVDNMNIVVRKRYSESAFGIESSQRSDAVVGESKRLYFVTPWRDCTVIGTSHRPYDGKADSYRVTERQTHDFVEEVQDACPALDIAPSDVAYVYAGLTPSDRTAGGAARSRKSEVIDYSNREDVNGLLAIMGVKYTTARALAEQAIDRIGRNGKDIAPSRSATTRLPGAVGFESQETLVDKIGRDGVDNKGDAEDLAIAYGCRYRDVIRLAEGALDSQAVFDARTRHAVRKEMAVKLSDVAFRRFDWMPRGLMQERELKRAADIMTEELGWTAEKRARELASVNGICGAAPTASR